MERGQQMPEKALIGGKERDGHGLCIARGKVHGGVHLGKAGACPRTNAHTTRHLSHGMLGMCHSFCGVECTGNHLRDGMMVSYGGEEHTIAPYEVLTFEDGLA